MLSIKQGSIKYHFLSLWHDSIWDWTPVSLTIGEHSIPSEYLCLNTPRSVPSSKLNTERDTWHLTNKLAGRMNRYADTRYHPSKITYIKILFIYLRCIYISIIKIFTLKAFLISKYKRSLRKEFGVIYYNYNLYNSSNIEWKQDVTQGQFLTCYCLSIEFSISYIGHHAKAKEPSLSYYSPLVKGRIGLVWLAFMAYQPL